MSTAADPKNLNPALASASPVLELSAFLFSYTVRYDDHAKPVPDAVTEIPTTQNGDVSADGKTIKYKLRHGMKWHDGAEVTCRDLRFTWQVMVNPKNNVNTTDGWREIQSVDCTDPYVAVVHLKRVYAPFLQQLWSLNGNGPIMPEHLLAQAQRRQGQHQHRALQLGARRQRPVQVRLVGPRQPGAPRGQPRLLSWASRRSARSSTRSSPTRTRSRRSSRRTSSTSRGTCAASSLDRVKCIPGDTTVTPVVYTFDHIDFNLRRPIFAGRARAARADLRDRPQSDAREAAPRPGRAQRHVPRPDAVSRRAEPRHHEVSVRSGQGEGAARRGRLEASAPTASG